jgi:hypothetical protein
VILLTQRLGGALGRPRYQGHQVLVSLFNSHKSPWSADRSALTFSHTRRDKALVGLTASYEPYKVRHDPLAVWSVSAVHSILKHALSGSRADLCGVNRCAQPWSFCRSSSGCLRYHVGALNMLPK